MSFKSWVTETFTPLVKVAVDEAIKDLKADIINEIKAEINDFEVRLSHELDPIEQAIGNFGANFAGIEAKIADAEKNVLGNVGGIAGQLTSIPEQIINGILGKLPHFPGF